MPVLSSGGQRLHFELIDNPAPWGTDPCTILFHHGIGTDSGIWAKWTGSFVDRYRIVRFDMRGFGQSDVPAPGSLWSMHWLWHDVLAVANATDTACFHFVGESIGGTIGLYGALQDPNRVLSLTMSNASHVGASIHKVEGWQRTIAEVGMKSWSDQFMADRFYLDALTPEQWSWFARQQEAGNPDAVLNALAVLVGVDLSAELGSVRPPVLILHPDSSPFIPVDVAAQLYAGLPDAELHVFGHSRHGLPFSHSAECAATLRRFLQRRFGE